MKKGLTLTLLAMSIVWVGSQANAMAPVVAELPEYIVGNADLVTGVTGFVFEDAIPLDDYVNDPDGDDASILWSFDNAGRYLLNGVDPLGSGDPLAPGAMDIASESNLNDVDLDDNARTVTIRDQIYTPLSGTGTTPTNEWVSEVVTLYASDGSTYTQTETVVYSHNNGVDGTSPQGPPEEIRIGSPFIEEYEAIDVIGATMTKTALEGLCMEVAETGVNFGTWATGLGAANGGEDLVANKIYRFRLYVTSDQTTSMKVPLADFAVENVDPGVAGDFAYASDFWFHDNVGSANAAKGPAVGRDFMEAWFAPPAVGTDQWNDPSTGAFTSGHDANNDIRFRWRTLDSDGAYGGANDSGTICLDHMVTQRFDLSDLVPVPSGTVFSVTDFGTADVTMFDVVTGSGAQESNFDTSGGELILTPQNAVGWDLQISTVVPGDNVWDPIADTGLPDDFPIDWEDETLYQIVLSVAANGSAGGAGETDGPDAIRISMDNPGFEIISENYMTTGLDRAGAPKAGTPQDYMSFHHGNSESLSSVDNHHRLRTRFDTISTTSYDRPAGNTNNTGGIEFHSWIVRKVTFPGWNVN
jgi:hypothetical protein